MCLILFAYESHPSYRLVIAANRDEFYGRPTEKARFWEDDPNILAGRDLEKKGTWLGVTRTGKISMLTNYRDPADMSRNAPSRGLLVSDFLRQGKPREYLEKTDTMGEAYNGFNMVLGHTNDLWYYSNKQRKITMLGSGVYGLSNHLLETPWPKVTEGKKMLQNVLENDRIDPTDLLDKLYDNLQAPDEHLPETGVGLDLERVLSPIFIKSPRYGTRCSTVILVDKDDNLSFTERVYNTDDFTFEENTFEYRIEN